MQKLNILKTTLKMRIGPRYPFIKILFLVLVLFIAVRCGQVPQIASPPSGTFANVYNIIQNNNCSQCHVPGGNQNGATLDFSTQSSAYTTLLAGTVSGASTSVCNSIKIVKAGDPSHSYLAAEISGTYNINNFAGVSGCKPYPYNTASHTYNLTSDQQNSIIQWIQNGALNN